MKPPRPPMLCAAQRSNSVAYESRGPYDVTCPPVAVPLPMLDLRPVLLPPSWVH